MPMKPFWSTAVSERMVAPLKTSSPTFTSLVATAVRTTDARRREAALAPEPVVETSVIAELPMATEASLAEQLLPVRTRLEPVIL